MRKINETNLLSMMMSNDSLGIYETNRQSKSKSWELGKTLLKDYMSLGKS